MAEIVNFNKARKTANRSKKKRQADENAVKFGRTKAQKQLENARADKAAQELDGKKRDE
ncbi:DUF4169 family protein [Marimonas lutisalis]|uniref:DUF4169 family protein n=1 Tax=Marimonas lutisalis TaxID=2545756 RepID=UPI0010F8780F|nr:DUF4169 family protein [Marimonas lutisalis]